MNKKNNRSAASWKKKDLADPSKAKIMVLRELRQRVKREVKRLNTKGKITAAERERVFVRDTLNQITNEYNVPHAAISEIVPGCKELRDLNDIYFSAIFALDSKS